MISAKLERNGAINISNDVYDRYGKKTAAADSKNPNGCADQNFFITKNGAWFDVNTGGSFFRIIEMEGCFLNSFSRNCRTFFRSHPPG